MTNQHSDRLGTLEKRLEAARSERNDLEICEVAKEFAEAGDSSRARSLLEECLDMDDVWPRTVLEAAEVAAGPLTDLEWGSVGDHEEARDSDHQTRCHFLRGRPGLRLAVISASRLR